MELLEALLLGLIQGLTEFFPVSSSGHLVIFQRILGFNQPPVFFDVIVHVATLIPIIFVFKDQIININKKTIIAIGIGSIPTVFIGLFLSSFTDQLFNSLNIVGAALLLTSLLLLSTKKIQSNINQKEVSNKNAFIIGIAQGLAVIPGISRSGATIITALWLGFTKKRAIIFSFLLSIPAILGAQFLQVISENTTSNQNPTILLVGFISAAISGLVALKLLQRVVEKTKLHWFTIYTFILALILLFS